MSGIRFNHVFVGLLLLAGLSAFIINPRYSNRIRNVQGLFAPVAGPTRRVAAAVNDRIAKEQEKDHRALADIRRENEQLRTTLMGLNGQIEELRRINAERSKLGDLRPLCTPVQVVGTDTGTRESLSLTGSSSDAIMQGMAVIYSGGLVGRIDRVGAAGSQVQLVSDREFRATGRFVYWLGTPGGEGGGTRSEYRGTIQALAQGDGKGGLVVPSYPAKDASLIRIGDELVLEDPEWPVHVKGQRIGQVTAMTPRRDAPLFYEIHLKPLRNLKELQEVMVLTKAVVR